MPSNTPPTPEQVAESILRYNGDVLISDVRDNLIAAIAQALSAASRVPDSELASLRERVADWKLLFVAMESNIAYSDADENGDLCIRVCVNRPEEEWDTYDAPNTTDDAAPVLTPELREAIRNAK